MQKTKTCPFFSIITSTYNAEKTLPRLLGSLAEQSCQDFIWICQDGVSTDSTMSIIEQWKDKFTISAESLKDTGIYDAWNKAIDREQQNLGQWILFLGADDLLAAPDVLEQAKKKLCLLSDSTILGVGEVQYFASCNTTKAPTCTNISKAFSRRMYGTPLPHTGLFARKSLFENKAFDENLKICADYKWMLNVWQREEQATHLNLLVAKMAEGGISTNPENFNLFYTENFKICMQHFGHKNWVSTIQIVIWFIEMKLSSPKMALARICQKNHFLSLCWKGLHYLRKKTLSIK